MRVLRKSDICRNKPVDCKLRRMPLWRDHVNRRQRTNMKVNVGKDLYGERLYERSGMRESLR